MKEVDSCTSCGTSVIDFPRGSWYPDTEDSPRNCSSWELLMLAMATGKTTGRAISCDREKKRFLYSSINPSRDKVGNWANSSEQALLIQGHSNLCPLSSFKLNTVAAFSTDYTSTKKNLDSEIVAYLNFDFVPQIKLAKLRLKE